MQKILTKREKLILYVTIGVIIFGIGFNFLLAPVLNKCSALNREINLTRIKLKKYRLLLSQKGNIQKKYNRFASKANLAGTNKDALVNILSELEILAKEANIRIIDIRPQSTSESSSLHKEVSIELRAEGAIDGYLKFIYNIENSLSLLRIKKFQLSAKPNAQTLEGNFSISQFSLE